MLNLGSSDDTQVRIEETGEVQGRNMTYAILSYLWGEDPTLSKDYETTSKNIQYRLAGFPLSELPKTIRDAVDIARALGFSYLWVDAVCILQDQDRRVIQRHIDAMPEFYARATIVISAACAAHRDAGSLEPRHPLYREYKLPFSLIDGENTEDSYIKLVKRVFKAEREPIDTKCWPQQEHKNALCILRFESEQVLWKCQETSFADSDIDMLSSPSPRTFSTSSFDGSMFTSTCPQTQADQSELHLAKWLEEVIDYSVRRAGTLDDKLAAFERTAKHMAGFMGWDPRQYKAGLWMRDMQRELLWCRDVHLEIDATASIPTSVTLTPSWSWASIQSPIAWRDQNHLWWDEYTLEVVECRVKLMSSWYPFKNVKKGLLVVRGYVRDAFWSGREIVGGTLHGGADRQVHHGRRLSAELPIIPIEVVWDAPVEPAPQRVKCLEIRSGVKTVGHSFGIILNHNGGSTSKRLGYFQFRHRTRNVAGTRKLEETEPNWLHQKRRRKIYII